MVDDRTVFSPNLVKLGPRPFEKTHVGIWHRLKTDEHKNLIYRKETMRLLHNIETVSYTHLTLPTIYSV